MLSDNPSPLNRVLKQGAPGAVWQPDEDVNANDHSIKFEYLLLGSYPHEPVLKCRY